MLYMLDMSHPCGKIDGLVIHSNRVISPKHVYEIHDQVFALNILYFWKLLFIPADMYVYTCTYNIDRFSLRFH